jgi:hypothetical protein
VPPRHYGGISSSAYAAPLRPYPFLVRLRDEVAALKSRALACAFEERVMSPNATSPRRRDEFDDLDPDMPELHDREADLPSWEDAETGARQKPKSRGAESETKAAERDVPGFDGADDEAEAPNPEFGADIERELTRPKRKKPSILGTLFLLVLIALVGLATGFALVMLL